MLRGVLARVVWYVNVMRLFLLITSAGAAAGAATSTSDAMGNPMITFRCDAVTANNEARPYHGLQIMQVSSDDNLSSLK
jgi:hypothetical protein